MIGSFSGSQSDCAVLLKTRHPLQLEIQEVATKLTVAQMIFSGQAFKMPDVDNLAAFEFGGGRCGFGGGVCRKPQKYLGPKQQQTSSATWVRDPYPLEYGGTWGALQRTVCGDVRQFST